MRSGWCLTKLADQSCSPATPLRCPDYSTLYHARTDLTKGSMQCVAMMISIQLNLRTCNDEGSKGSMHSVLEQPMPWGHT